MINVTRARPLIGLLVACACPAACEGPEPAAPPGAGVGATGGALDAELHWACVPDATTCDRVLEPNGTGYLAFDGTGLAPGSRICLKAGQYGELVFKNLLGTASAPIEVTNCGGRAVIGSSGGTLAFSNSKHFRAVGTGSTDPAAKYGIKIDGSLAAGQGVSVAGGSTNFEIAWLEVDRADFAGVMAKSDPDCARKYTRENFVQLDTHIHHNYIHDTRRGEGFYIGYFTHNAVTKTCDGQQVTLLPHELKGVRIHDNLVERAASDGLQLGCAVADVDVYRNVIDGYGMDPFQQYQNNGVQIGGASTGRWHDNVIRNGGGGNAFIVFGPAVWVYNNVLENTGGIYFHNEIPAGAEVAVLNNTFVRTTRRGFERGALVSNPSRIKIHNNIMVHDSTVAPIPSGSGFTASNNLFTTDEAVPKFVNSAGGDFHLRADSPARDAGANMGAYLTTDFEGDSRADGAFDIGADEYGGGGGGGGAAFSQNFSSSTSVAAYVNAAAPSSGQFNDIGAEINGGAWSIAGGRLRLVREGIGSADSGAGFERWTDLAAPPPAALAVRFDVGVSDWTISAYQNNALCLAVGNFAGHIDYSSAGASYQVFNLLCVDGKGPGAFAFETAGLSSANYAADGTMYRVSYFLNGSSATLGYRGPDGSMRSLGPGRVAVWVGTSLQIDGALASNGSGSALTDFRMYWGAANNGTWELDNFVIDTSLPQ
ncbi:MAG TPA: right-handed parallel beta-helix repeat-containing protein [Polyangiaceae bacterium]|nr:right-handed parallel beta-helix repeat-containing protein [Polyangiaceae bacterium]